jgi:Dehydratase medium subunit
MIIAYVHDATQGLELAAAAEEEGVPLTATVRRGAALTLARDAARTSQLGIGIGADQARLVVVLAASPAIPFLEATPAQARTLGHWAARIAARRPLDGPV